MITNNEQLKKFISNCKVYLEQSCDAIYVSKDELDLGDQLLIEKIEFVHDILVDLYKHLY